MDTGLLPVQLAGFVLLLTVSAYCSCSETVFFSLNPLQLRRIGARNAELGRRVHHLLAQPTRLLSTVLILNTLVNTIAAALAYLLVARVLPERIAEPVSIAGMTVILLLFGEYGPKRLGLMFADRLAGVFVPIAEALILLATPVRLGLEGLTRAFGPLFRPRGTALTGEEFATVLDVSGAEGIINGEELAMTKAIVGLERMRAADLMTPRVDIRGIDLESDPASWPDLARRAKRHFLVLYRDQLDRAVGFLDVRRFLLDPSAGVDAATLPLFFVPETCTLNRLLPQFQRGHRRVALVVDEYGGTAGLVTRGDVLERISGEVYQELSRPRPTFQPSGPNRWLLDAGFSIEELNRKLGLDLEAEGVERLAGWIAFHLGHIPAAGESVETPVCRVTVLQTDQRRVTLAQLEKREAPP